MVVKSLRGSRYQMCRRIYYTTSRCIASPTHPIFRLGEVLTLSEYYNLTVFCHLQVASLQKLVSVGPNETAYAFT